jgi:small subunit ribosomal protein S2
LKKSLHQVEKYYLLLPKKAKDIVAEKQKLQTCLITERWPGGMLTNFVTIRKAVKKWLLLIK